MDRVHMLSPRLLGTEAGIRMTTTRQQREKFQEIKKKLSEAHLLTRKDVDKLDSAFSWEDDKDLTNTGLTIPASITEIDESSSKTNYDINVARKTIKNLENTLVELKSIAKAQEKLADNERTISLEELRESFLDLKQRLKSQKSELTKHIPSASSPPKKIDSPKSPIINKNVRESIEARAQVYEEKLQIQWEKDLQKLELQNSRAMEKIKELNDVIGFIEKSSINLSPKPRPKLVKPNLSVTANLPHSIQSLSKLCREPGSIQPLKPVRTSRTPLLHPL